MNINTSLSYNIIICESFCFPAFRNFLIEDTDMKLNYGKTIYTFMYGGEPVGVNNIVQGWLTANGFSLVNNFGETYYYHNDAWHGNRCFQYTIEANILTIYAWTIAIGNKFVMLDSGAPNNMAGDAYKQALNSLFSEINLHCPPNPGNMQDPNTMQTVYPPQENAYQGNANQGNPYQAGPVPDASQFVNAFQNEIDERNEKLCTIGFCLSLIGLLLSIFGFMFGVLIYILEIYFACQGLKTRKRGKAIATFIIAGISILIIIGWIIG